MTAVRKTANKEDERVGRARRRGRYEQIGTGPSGQSDVTGASGCPHIRPDMGRVWGVQVSPSICARYGAPGWMAISLPVLTGQPV